MSIYNKISEKMAPGLFGYTYGQDSEFATRYGYPKTAFKPEPDPDKDISNTFLDISTIQTPKKLHIAQSCI